MGAPYVNGPAAAGTPILSINSVAYVCNSFDVDKSASTEDQTDQNGAYSAAVSTENARKGSAELQFAASTTAEPTTAAANTARGKFSANIDGANVNCFITAVSISKPKPPTPWTAKVSWQADAV